MLNALQNQFSLVQSMSQLPEAIKKPILEEVAEKVRQDEELKQQEERERQEEIEKMAELEKQLEELKQKHGNK